jgi:hypothetical protein
MLEIVTLNIEGTKGNSPPYFAFVDQDAISVGDDFEHLNSGLGLLVVLV